MEDLTIEQIKEKEINEAKAYLISTDWYYVRKAETGEEVPEEVIAKRAEAREFIRANEGVSNGL